MIAEIAYHDDCVVASICASKAWAPLGEPDSIEIGAYWDVEEEVAVLAPEILDLSGDPDTDSGEKLLSLQ